MSQIWPRAPSKHRGLPNLGGRNNTHRGETIEDQGRDECVFFVDQLLPAMMVVDYPLSSKQPTKQSINQPINQSINQSIYIYHRKQLCCSIHTPIISFKLVKYPMAFQFRTTSNKEHIYNILQLSYNTILLMIRLGHGFHNQYNMVF